MPRDIAKLFLNCRCPETPSHRRHKAQYATLSASINTHTPLYCDAIHTALTTEFRPKEQSRYVKEFPFVHDTNTDEYTSAIIGKKWPGFVCATWRSIKRGFDKDTRLDLARETRKQGVLSMKTYLPSMISLVILRRCLAIHHSLLALIAINHANYRSLVLPDLWARKRWWKHPKLE